MNNQDLFMKMLDLALLQAESKYEYPGKLLSGYARIAAIIRGGNTNFVNVDDPALTISQYIREVYTGKKMPMDNSIAFAERGH